MVKKLISTLVFPILVIFLMLSACNTEKNANYTDDAISLENLKTEFQNIPSSSKPFTWWHWINGNITREGITKDLEWMKEFGLGGAIVFNVGMLSDEVPRKVPFGTDEWWGMVDHAIKEADRLGLKLGFHNCDGWSHSGGPWMDVENSMKKMVWTEKFVRAGEKDIFLEQPETKLNYYRDVAILAFPVNDRNGQIIPAGLNSNLPGDDVRKLFDKDPATSVDLSKTRGHVRIDLDFSINQKIASITLKTNEGRMRGVKLSLEVSSDGENFQVVKDFISRSKGILGWKTNGEGSSISFSFPEQNTQYFRINISEKQILSLSEIHLFETSRIDNWEMKAAQIQYTEHGGAAEYYYPDIQKWQENYPDSEVKNDDIIDLTDQLDENNRLSWTPSEGNWRILRIGQTTNGKTNSPSTVEGRGLEADKLNPDALEKHYNSFMKEMLERNVNENTNSFAYTEIDSWEAGVQNWTDGLMEEFQKINGYDMRSFLPVLAGGFIVESYEKSERFLWDFRNTLSYLIQSGCFNHLAELAGDDGLTVFTEGSGRQQYLYNPIDYQMTADIPKGEFWVGRDMGANIPDEAPRNYVRPRIDCKVASSVAHIYGGNLAASESFTGGTITFEQGPFDLKILGDKAFCMGVNWIVLHTSAHQPYSTYKPGFSLGMAGSHFHRNNIVYEENYGWLDYVTRSQYLLRQGRFVADVLCYLGEDVPTYLGFRNELTVPLPEGYDYDGCNTDILLNHTRVQNGKIILDSGMEYKYLLMPENPVSSPEILMKIQELVKKGATVIGPKPLRAYGMAGANSEDKLVKELAEDIWGDFDGESIKENKYGKGKVIRGKSFEEIFESDKLKPDFHFTTNSGDPEINYIHRQIGDLDVYFVANSTDDQQNILATFRVQNKIPEFFQPGSGEIVPVAGFQPKEEGMEIPLSLPPAGSVFVVFKPGKIKESVARVSGPAFVHSEYRNQNEIELIFQKYGDYEILFSNGNKKSMGITLPPDIKMNEDWEIIFPGYHGEVAKTIHGSLQPWNESDDPFVKYYSGTATYSQNFDLVDEYLKSDLKVKLDLGEVQEIALVRINGKPAGRLWKKPFEVDISKLVVPGENRLEIEVTNTWANRMIGDDFLPLDLNYLGRYIGEIPTWLDGKTPRPTDRVTFGLAPFYSKNDELIESGLIGPVKIKVLSEMIVSANEK